MPDDCDTDDSPRPQGQDFLSVLQRLQHRDRLIVSTSLDCIARSRALLARLQLDQRTSQPRS